MARRSRSRGIISRKEQIQLPLKRNLNFTVSHNSKASARVPCFVLTREFLLNESNQRLRPELSGSSLPFFFSDFSESRCRAKKFCNHPRQSASRMPPVISQQIGRAACRASV